MEQAKQLTLKTTTTADGGTHGGAISPRRSFFEIRLFYVRISPCNITTVPNNLTLRHIPDNYGGTLEINSSRIPISSDATTTLRRDRVDKDASEVTYVSTDTIRVTGGFDFEVNDGVDLLLCGSIGRLENEWSLDCYPAVNGETSFCQPKLGINSPSFEVYIAGRWLDVPVILTKMVSVVSPRRKSPRYSALDSIPEVSDEVEKDRKVVLVSGNNSLIRHRKLEITGSDDECDVEGKMAHNYYPQDLYIDEDGQLSWFNAGVRVGVGIGLGMCVGLGIGVGLLMRSYQTTTRTFRRRFF